MAFKKRPRNRDKFKEKKERRAAEGEIWLDYSTVPADLAPEEIDELFDALPKSTRKTKPAPVEYRELQGLNLAELHELGTKEKVDLDEARSRRDVVWDVTVARMEKRIPVIAEGVLDVVDDHHAFLRTHHASYLATHEDVYVPRSMVERYALRTGMTVRGPVRPPKEGERWFCLAWIDAVDFHDPEEIASRTPFKELVPLYPEERLLLEGGGENPLEMRIMDLVTPIGKGQRGLIVAPPRTGKTVLLQQIANSIVSNNPEVHLIILLVDERPEEVTDFERQLSGERREIVSSTFDEPPARHLKVAHMTIERARSLVEAGEDVVILLDSITRLARASNQEAPSDGKLLSGGLEATSLQFPKRFFGSARNIEDGGSLTILGTALIETGSKMDEVIFEEFKGTGNAELVLERRLADRRIFPAIDINRSGTRKEELLFTPQEIERVWMLRKVLNELDPVEAMEMLVQKIRRTKVNGEFLMTIGS
ncbi:MAG: transcription termination factor Rho [Planctomycetota bacterium]